MARKWERMVEKNKKLVNKNREKGGKVAIKETGHPDYDLFKGRSIFLPVFFMSISLLFMMFFGQTGEQDALYWITVICYFLLSLYFFFLKRPYLKISKKEIAVRKLGREKVTSADELEKITIQPTYIIISIKGKRTQLIFSKFFNRYDLDSMAEKLKSFAQQHTIHYEVEK